MWFQVILVIIYNLAEIGGIKGIRLSSSIFGTDRDGLLELNYLGKWGTVCAASNFGITAASVACYMLGFPPKGVPFEKPDGMSNLEPILGQINCDNQILINGTIQTEVFHLGNCDLDPVNIPTRCNKVAIACLEPAPYVATTTPVPNLATLPPINCDETSENVRLVASSLPNAGRLEVKHPENHTWGTVCADGFGINEARAFCRMLCAHDTDLSYARPVLYAFNREPANASQPIYLKGITCPPDASNLNDCDFGSGWDYSGSCTHSMDVGIQCGPQISVPTEAPISPQLNCTKEAAVLTFNKEKNPELIPSMLTLNNRPSACNFTSLDYEISIIVTIPYKGCGGLIIKDNPQSLSIGYNLTRQVLSSATGIITALPRTFTATCIVPRDGAAKTDALASQVQAVTLAPVSDERIVPTAIGIFSDAFFQQELLQPVDIPPNTLVYVRVQLVDPLPENKLVLKSCWVTASENPLSVPRQDLIVDKCPVLQGLNLIPISRTEIGFSMPMFYLTSQANSIVDASSSSSNSRLQIFFHCTTGLCHRSETSSTCSQFCANPSSIAATVLRSLRRAKRSLETEVYARAPLSYLFD